jgi:hypothetical protein
MSSIRAHTNRLQGEIQMLQMRRRTLHPHLHQSENNRREVCKLWRPSPRQLHRMQIPPHTSKKKNRNSQTHKRLEPNKTRTRAANKHTKPNPNTKSRKRKTQPETQQRNPKNTKQNRSNSITNRQTAHPIFRNKTHNTTKN